MSEDEPVKVADLEVLLMPTDDLHLLVMSREIVSGCCDAPVTARDCPACGKACETTQVLKAMTLGEGAQALIDREGGGDLSLWAAFGDVAVAYGDRWIGPPASEFRALRERAYPGSWRDPRYSGRAYEEFRERFCREKGLS